jgi:mono/diheme cytochrome c family protein
MKHTAHPAPVSRVSIPIISGMAVALLTAGLWAADGAWKAPSFRARKKNPVPADIRSIAEGKKLYIQECLSCHGSSGRGDGQAAKDLDIPPGDLTSPGVAGQSDGALFWKISTGRSPMPTFEPLMTEQQRWQVVNYIRTLAATVPVTSPRYDAPASYRQAVSSVIKSYLTLTEYLAGDKPDVPTDQTAALAAAAQTLAGADTAELPDAAKKPWRELTQALRKDVQKLGQAQDADAARLQLKSVSDSLTRLVQAFGHAGDTPLVLIHCDMSFGQTGASWLQGADPPHNPYTDSKKERDCGQAVARLAPQIGEGDKPAS